MLKKTQVAVIGGGTGTATVLAALAAKTRWELTAMVSVSDSGGSTGRLRDEFGFIPVGDIRQCLSALATGKSRRLVQEMLLYRFQRGDGLAHHNLGNLILTALTDLYQTPGKAIEVASKILRINGKVYPISEQPANLVIDYVDGKRVVGEDYLNYQEHGGVKIAQISLREPAVIYEPARVTLETADLVIMGPGDLYASLLPNALVDGFREALAKNAGKFVYIVNLMTSKQQTYQMSAADHVAEVQRYTGRQPDVVIMNQQTITEPKVIANYKRGGYAPVKDDLGDGDGKMKIYRADLVAEVMVAEERGDTLPRNFLRHHAQNLLAVIEKLI
jgi:uncharacterized cofD-like protein